MALDPENIEFIILSDNLPPNFSTKKFEFVYFDNMVVPENTPYRIMVLKDKTEVYVKMRTLPLFDNIDLPFPYIQEEYSEVMLKRDPINNSTSRFRYLRFANGDNSRDVYIKPHQITLTKVMKKKQSITRYFAQYKLDLDKDIFEISKVSYELQSDFYKKVLIQWQLQGSKENILLKNNKELEEADKTLNGIKDYLDPLEFYEGPKLTPEEELQKKISNLK